MTPIVGFVILGVLMVSVTVALLVGRFISRSNPTDERPLCEARPDEVPRSEVDYWAGIREETRK